MTNYVNKIDKTLLGWKSNADGAWNKGALTTALCKFIEHFCRIKRFETGLDEELRLVETCLFWQCVLYAAPTCIYPCYMHVLQVKSDHTFPAKASGIRALNFWMSSLFKAPLFIPQKDAKGINRAGQHFLACYSRLALLSCRSKQCRFSLIPKLHMLWHMIDWMTTQATHASFVYNVMAESCGSDEDLIGRFCVLTRSVSPRQRVRRSLERYLTQVLLLWSR